MPPRRLRGPSFSMPSNARAACAMPGGRRRRIRSRTGCRRALRRWRPGSILRSFRKRTRCGAGPRKELSGDGQLFFELLLLVKAGVVAFAGEQLVVAADLDDAAAVEHRDAIGVAHRGNAVGDE